MTKKELAKRLNTSQPNISKKFKFNDWRESDLREIAKILDCEYEAKFKLNDGSII